MRDPAGDVHRIVHTTRLHRALIARFGAVEALRRMERDGDDPAYYCRLALTALRNEEGDRHER